MLGASIGGVPAALKAWATATNAAGGIACHNVIVYSVDDGGSAAAARSAVQDFVENKHVAALNAFVPLTSAGIRPYIDGQRIPVIGGDVASPPWFTSPYFFPQGPGIDASLFAAMNYARQKGGTKFGIVYCIEAQVCSDARNAAKNGIVKKAGLEYTYEAPVSLTGTNFSQQCTAAKNAGVDVLFPALTATGAGAVARDCRQQNFGPTLMTLSLAATDALAADPNMDGTVMGVSVFPWMYSGKPAQANFQAMMKRYAPTVGLSGGVAGAWASGEMFRAALLKLGAAARGTITPALVLQGLHMFKNESLGGLTPNLTFPPGKPAAPIECAFIAQAVRGKWTAPIGDNQICG